MDFLLIVVNVIIFLALAPLFEGVIRKITARVQSRQGPPVVQPYYDLMKLLGKESIVSGNWTFKAAPVMAFASIVTAIAIIPLGFRQNYMTLNADVITIIYLLTLGGVSVLLGALSSRNIYASIGASREMITMIMVEPVLAMTFIFGAVRVKSLGVGDTMLSLMSNGYNWSVLIMLVLFLFALQAFVGRQPFDIAEAEIEIVEGPFIEYSGPNYALFKYYMMLKQMFYAALFVTVFFSFIHTGIYIFDVLIQLAEIFVVFVIISLVSSTNPRFRIDQAVKYYSVLIVLSVCAVCLSVYGL